MHQHVATQLNWQHSQLERINALHSQLVAHATLHVAIEETVDEAAHSGL